MKNETLVAQFERVNSLNREFSQQIENLEINNKFLISQNELYSNKLAEKDSLIESKQLELKHFKDETYVRSKEFKQKNEELFQEITSLNNKLNFSEQNLNKHRDEWSLEKSELSQIVSNYIKQILRNYFLSFVKI
jgi:hypothetical protein